MLGQLPPDRKQSMPVFPVSAQKERQYSDSSYMARSPEVENIPESVHERELRNDSFDRPSSIHRTQSAVNQAHEANQANESFQGESPRLLYRTGEESPPPPPPPIYDKETPRERARAREHSFDDNTVSVTGASKSTTSAASFTLTSSASVTSRGTEDSEDDVRRKRYPADKAYYIAKELLMTERTYKKDLEVITVWFRNAVSKDDVMPDRLMELLFGTLDPIYEFHCSFLREVEQRLAMWEGKSNAHLNGDYQRIGDIMLNNMTVLQLYSSYLSCHEEILSELELATKHNKLFEQIYTEFETQKVCYLPFNTFLLKPAQRLLHYRLILDRLLKHYSADQADFRDCQVSLSKIHEVTLPFEDKMKYLENMQKLIELQRDLVGLDTLVQPSREFIREGCLQKLSRKGYQQRMFFLFSDMLVYTSRTATPSSQFKVHGQLPLKGMIVEETEAATNSFTIYGGNRCLLLAASSQEERDKWLEDLHTSIQAAKSKDDHEKNLYPSLKSNSSSEALEDGHDEPKSPPTPDRQMQHRANTTMHVCWHRNTSVSMRDHNTAVQNQLSGYLLRKFKNSNGWQKLWVVFTNFCLFFYKTFQDDFPLASLPLLGYSVSTPSPTDGVHKDYVFKLQFKNHVYFFRAESQYTFERWMEVTRSATDTAQRVRLFSRMESNTMGQSSEVILSTSPSIPEQ